MKLPSAYNIEPYLRQIDAAGVYSNFGPLNEEYCTSLGKLFKSHVVTTSSATSGLTAAILALGLPKNSFIACPSWTFIATPAAIVMAGHIPYFVDVMEDGTVDEITLRVLSIRNKIDAAVIVSPCGAPIDIPDIGIPIVVDAAGGFDTVKSGGHPSVVSTHATKVFGTGEGGFVICDDKKLLEKIRRITNFGFDHERNINILGFNAKLSEYHAAVGLAELDGWESKRKNYLDKLTPYGINYATSLIAIKDEGGNKVYGCHHHKIFKDYPRTRLTVTESLISKTSFVKI